VDRKIVEKLLQNQSQNEIMSDLGVGKKRVRRARAQAEALGYFAGKPLPPFPGAVFADPLDKRTEKGSDNDTLLQTHLAWITDRLQIGWLPVTVWEELPSKVSRSSFYRFIERHQLGRVGEKFRHTPEITHAAGEALILDWGKLRDVVENGKSRTLWAFVGVLGYSRYMMVRLVWTNDVAMTIGALESMLAEVGGVPRRLTSDNPKCFALEASLYEPILNPVIERFASHYGVRMECLPPADPQKKGKVERMIPFTRRLYQAHGDDWSGIAESQSYLDKKLVIANERQHGSTKQRPIDDFNLFEKAALKPLPPLAYEIEELKEGDVRKDGFVSFKNKNYSVDEHLRGEPILVVASRTRVAIYHKGILVETHERITDPHQNKSIKPHHQQTWEKTLEDHGHYLTRARQVGADVERLIQAILLTGEGFVDTRKVWGILSLEKSFAKESVNEACRKALELGLLSYRTVQSLLKLKPDIKSRPPKEETATENESGKFVRPMSDYAKQFKLH